MLKTGQPRSLEPQPATGFGGEPCFAGLLIKAQGDFSGAKNQYESFLAIAEKIRKLDPTNTRGKAICLKPAKSGQVLVGLGDLDAANDEYQRSLEIRRKPLLEIPATVFGNTIYTNAIEISAHYRNSAEITMVPDKISRQVAIFDSLIRLHGENPPGKSHLDLVKKELG